MDIHSVFIAVFILLRCNPGESFISNSLRVIQEVADGTVGAVAKRVVDQVRKVVDVSATASQNVNDSSLLGKIREGVYDVKNGIISGVDEVVGTPVTLDQLTFYLVTAENVENPTIIDFFKPDDLAQTNGRIIFLIHGWMSYTNSVFYTDLSKIFTSKYPDSHIVLLDWDQPASDYYPFSAFDTESVGEYVGILINRLLANYGVSLANILLIGHSLGAHISGFASKTFTKITGKKLPRIIALDPAGPLFVFRPNSKRLNKDDADVVMVMHTDAGVFGYPTVIGTIDFFPNNGANQPGCWKKLKAINLATYSQPVTCDHSRAWKYFIEAVEITGSFPSRKCDSYENFENGNCDRNEIVTMGDLDTVATGSFFLKTNSKPPFSIPLP
ncbi:hypothetical protein WA026_018316 [Henosepilachna vigintioctopunctata]|uniref:Lipase domain-containing protein n=1 Tax=Henosepilachna vigintioctopunctata TaxID=420089 RepID=A0AAW1VH73_9CUCU